MKKVGGLIALATVVTIGGVYATWTYQKEGTDIIDVSQNITVSVPSAQWTTSTGTYKIDSNVSLTIDEESAGSYKTALVFNDDAEITITFTPVSTMGFDICENGIESYFYFGMVDTTATYYKMDANGDYLNAAGTVAATKDEAVKVDIFTFAHTVGEDTRATIHRADYTGEGAKWTPSADGKSFTYTMDKTMLQQEIGMNVFYLDTKAEHDEFSTAVNSTKMQLHVSDGVIVTQ
ncbi:MAG: hypothetical protein IJZ32_05175 [Clostridia bacterium]|nr:hypothetical protein [Clostridia bacterium]